MLGHRQSFTVASGGTHSNFLGGDGYSLIGLIVPAMDSTTIQFEAAPDGVAANAFDVFTNSGTPAALTLGTADTGSKVVAVPEEVSRLSAVAFIRLQVAAQNGGARTIQGLWQKR